MWRETGDSHLRDKWQCLPEIPNLRECLPGIKYCHLDMTDHGTDIVMDTGQNPVTGQGMVPEEGHPGRVTGCQGTASLAIGHQGLGAQEVNVLGVRREEQGLRMVVIGLLSEVYLVRGLHGQFPVKGQGPQSAVTGPVLLTCHGIIASLGRPP